MLRSWHERREHTAKSVAQTVVLKPVTFALPVLIPLRRFIITVRRFLMCFRLFVIFSKQLKLSDRRNTLIKLCRSRIVSMFVLGRRKSCRSRSLPWGVLAKRWNKPYIDRPSFEEDDFLPGPWLNILGWDSGCNIWSDNRPLPLMSLLYFRPWSATYTKGSHMVSFKPNILTELILNKSEALFPGIISVVLRLCRWVRIAPAQPIVTAFSMSTELDMCSSRPSCSVKPVAPVSISSGPIIPPCGTRNCRRCSCAADISRPVSLLLTLGPLNSWDGRISTW